jgi:hypothetical protein
VFPKLWILLCIKTSLNMTVVVKSTVFWDITSCIPLKVNRRFGGTCHLHLHSWRISRERNQCESRWQAELWFLPRRILRPWRWRRCVPLKRRLTFNGLHGILSQKIVSFITTTVRTSNPTWLWLSVCLVCFLQLQCKHVDCFWNELLTTNLLWSRYIWNGLKCPMWLSPFLYC